MAVAVRHAARCSYTHFTVLACLISEGGDAMYLLALHARDSMALVWAPYTMDTLLALCLGYTDHVYLTLCLPYACPILPAFLPLPSRSRPDFPHAPFPCWPGVWEAPCWPCGETRDRLRRSHAEAHAYKDRARRGRG